MHTCDIEQLVCGGDLERSLLTCLLNYGMTGYNLFKLEPFGFQSSQDSFEHFISYFRIRSTWSLYRLSY